MNVFPPVADLSHSSSEETLKLGETREAKPKGTTRPKGKAKASVKAKPKSTPKKKVKPEPEVPETPMKKPAKRPASCLSSERGASQVFFTSSHLCCRVFFVSSSNLKVHREVLQAETYQWCIATRRPTSTG